MATGIQQAGGVMTVTYEALAQVYDDAGLGQHTTGLRQRLVDKIQMEGWLGRRILELGCGTGDVSCWFGANGFRVTAVDRSPAMLEQAREKAAALGTVVDWREQDFVHIDVDRGYDLVLGLNTFNEILSTRDLEATFRMANHALDAGKMLLFDLHTLQGLAANQGSGDRVLADAADHLTLILRSQYNFETSTNTQRYIIYRSSAAGWQRLDETVVLRGFALQVVGTLLQRSGFRVQQVVDGNLAPFDPLADKSGCAIFIAIKERDL
jgi:SAM-dependent methyltransferase